MAVRSQRPPGPAALLLAGLAAAAGVAAAGAAWGAEPATARARNVVLVTIDTLRADHVGAYGGPVATPHLDGIAAEGVLLEQATSPIPLTGPAHASLLTGLHPWRHGTHGNTVRLDHRIPTLAVALRAAGFQTAAFVSTYVLQKRFGFGRGFQHFVFEPNQKVAFQRERQPFWARGAATTRAARAWIRAHAARPFFVWIHYYDPHHPYQPPPPFRPPADAPVDLTGKTLPRSVKDERELAALIRGYRGEVAYSDGQVGRVIAQLSQLGILDQTAVVVTSDHGEALGDHGNLAHAASLYEELIRIPLLLRGPGLPRGRRLAGAAQLEDLHPTLLAWVGATPSQGVDGIDLLPWLRGLRDTSPRLASAGQRLQDRGRRLQYLRTFPSKWIGYAGQPGLRFDLARDPRESAGQPAQGAPPELLGLLGRAPRAPAGRLDPDPEARRALEALGYLEE